ncbi:aryl-alcohol-oxidase from pleurotus Eryingii [Dentipellis sp. KUC8613]|nr:aryl-alcohol-oxidase from pleurotus Eryingii [Dentipellis sp. KUC8613]
MLQWSSSFALLACLPAVFAKTYSDPSQVPTTKKYDYVVIGAGAGGATVAARLSENSGVNVLLIEAGISHQGIASVEIPFLDSSNAPNTYLDWNYTTTPQTSLNNRVIQYPRGKLLGGSTSINFMGYNRGSQNFWDRIARVTGDKGWSWSSLQPYFKKLERLTPPADHHNTNGQINPSAHGTSGPLGFSLPGYTLPIDSRIIGTTKELPSQFPFSLDQNAGTQIGWGWTQSTIVDGSRESSATAYLDPNANRGNLDIVLNAQATKLIQTGSQGGVPTFLGVQFAQSASSPRFAVNATKEVIVSAGAVGSPHLLMLSGIGPASQLQSHGIKPIVNAPGVGQNLQDHALLSNFWSVNSTGTFTIDDIIRNSSLFNDLMSDWQKDKMGMFVVGNPNQLGWERVPSNAPIFRSTQDPSSGPLSPHIEYLPFNGWISFVNPMPSSGNYLTIFTAVVAPAARGSITLTSSDPFTYPNINPNLLGSEFDRYAMRYAINATRAFTAASAWKGWILGEAGDLANAHTDAELDAYAAANTATIFHPTGTVSMQYTGGNGVLNSDLTVKGVNGLRVVDLSVLPYIPEAHPQGAVYVLAERVSDLIKASHH